MSFRSIGDCERNFQFRERINARVCVKIIKYSATIGLDNSDASNTPHAGLGDFGSIYSSATALSDSLRTEF